MKAPRFSTFKAKDGFRWKLKAANGEIIATGEAYTRREDADRAIQTVKDAVITIGIADMRAGWKKELAK
jgi:uncharacterized protein YegP (UPF0339 family)